MQRKWFCILVLLSCAVSIMAQAKPHHYVVEVHSLPAERKHEYVPSLLKLILEASKAPNEVIDIQFTDQRINQNRWVSQIATQPNNSVMWVATSKELEEMMRPIRVPIYKGLYGERVFVIRKSEQHRFDAVKNIKDLGLLLAGQGNGWPDVEVLQENGLPVVLGMVGVDNLYKMLTANRFDYFSRSIAELKAEEEYIKKYDVVIEKNLLLSYPSPRYFFVNKNNTELANRLEKGWNIIIKNGEFNTFFYNHPRIKAALNVLKKHKRRIIHLKNSSLPEKTPLNNPDYWLDISTLYR